MKKIAFIIIFCAPFFLRAQSKYDSCLYYYDQGAYDRVLKFYESDASLQGLLHDSTRLLDAVTTAYINQADYNKAKALLVSEKRQLRSVSETSSMRYAVVMNNLGLVFDEQMDFDSSLFYLNEGLKIRKKIMGGDNLAVAESYFNLGSLFEKAGDYDKAEDLLTKALSIESKHYKDDDPSLAMTMNNLGAVNEVCGRYAQALLYYTRAAKIFSVRPGKKSYPYGALLFNKAVVFLRQNQIDSASYYFNLSEEVLTEAKNFLPEYGLVKLDLINRLIISGQLKEATDKIAEVEKMVKEKNESWQYILPDLLLTKANLLVFENKLPEAIKMNDLATTQFLNFYSDKNASFPRFVDFKANLQFHQADRIGFYQSHQTIHRVLLNQIMTFFPSFSEREREQYYFRVRPYFEKYLTLLQGEKVKGAAGLAYDNQLATKAILLNYTNRWRQQILRSGDMELIKYFSTWQEMRSQIQADANKPEEKKGQSIDSLTEAVNLLEKQLAARSELFARQVDHQVATWQQVRGKLKKNEAAVEIIRFRRFDYNVKYDFTNEVYYAALIITSKTKSDPEVVFFPQENDLENRALKFYRNAILYKQEDNESYNSFWKPIADKLKGVRRVFVSPDGIFNLVNFNTLRNPKTGKYLLEEIELRQVTNTKDLLSIREQEEYNNYALLFGGPDYNMKRMNAKEIISKPASPSIGSYYSLRLERGSGLVFLPGAKKEVENLRDLLEAKNWKVDLFVGPDALEGNLKHSLKPKLLHIATHGYFQKDIVYDPNQRSFDNPLLRSGLMMAGAAEALEPHTEYDDISLKEDGVLTSYEAMELNLENTELVVLSACETGLGEIKNGEGVYGLQRAFKVAGARNLIMSLWKVDDEITQELMGQFYKNWLSSNDKHEALKKAQLNIMSKFPQPAYWGAFILVGN